MKTSTKFVIPIVAVAVFRPERLLMNRHVDEAMPTPQGGSSPQPPASGKSL